MYFSDSLVGNKKWGRGKKVECGESVVKTEKLKPHPTHYKNNNDKRERLW